MAGYKGQNYPPAGKKKKVKLHMCAYIAHTYLNTEICVSTCMILR